MQLHYQLFVYKQLINKPNSFNPSSFTNTKNMQLQYSEAAYLIFPLYVAQSTLNEYAHFLFYERELLINLFGTNIFKYGSSLVINYLLGSILFPIFEIPDEPPCCVRLCATCFFCIHLGFICT